MATGVNESQGEGGAWASAGPRAGAGAGAGRPWRIAAALRSPDRIVLVAAALTVALRLPFVNDLPYPDESGLLVVASHWQQGGPFLYGQFFVDRPPLLLGFFRLADAFGGVVPLRVLGLGLVVCAVCCAARAGRLLGGVRGSAAAALTCAALLADPLLGTREVDAETVGVPLVLLAALLALEGVRRDRGGVLWLTGAGAAGAAAVLVKQNLADGCLFVVALVIARALLAHVDVRRTLRELACVAAGVAIPGTAALAMSSASTGPKGLWYALYGFRIAGATSLFAHVSAAEVARVEALARSGLLSGLVVVLVVALALLLRRGRRDAVTVALVTMLVVEVVGVAGGGYYWTHYLIGLVPATSLLAGRAAGGVSRTFSRGHLVGAAIGICLVATSLDVGIAATHRTPRDSTEVGAVSAWLTGAMRPGDSAVVLYGEAPLFETTGLRPAYPFLWTLPQRVLDPHLTLLENTLDREKDPTFVVVRSSLHPSRDQPGGVQRILDLRYRLVARVCGDSIYLRRRVLRTTPAISGCSEESRT